MMKEVRKRITTTGFSVCLRLLHYCLLPFALCLLPFFSSPAHAQLSGAARDTTLAVRVVHSTGGGRTLYSGGAVCYFTVGSPVAGRVVAAPQAITDGFTAFLLGQHDTEPPAAFPLFTPSDSTDTNETTVVFSWGISTDSSPPIAYRLIVDTDMAGGYVVDSTVVNLTSITATLPAAETYSWRVVASDIRSNARTVGDSVLRLYTITAPTPISPINGESSPLTLRLFKWNAGATTGRSPLRDYRLQVALDTIANLETPVVDIRHNAATNETTPLYLFTANGAIWWRMQTRDTFGNSSAWSTPQYFTKAAPTETTGPLPPANFKVTSLDTGALFLTWDKSPSIDVVQYNVYWDSGLSTGAETLYAVAPHSGASHALLTSVLQHGREYRFRIAASDSQGNQGAEASAVATACTTPQAVANAITTEPTPGTKFRRGDSAVQILATLNGSARQLDSATTLTFQVRTFPAGAWTNMTVQTGVTGNANPIAVGSAKTEDGQYRFVWNPSALAADTYDVRIIVTDRAGETSALTAGVNTIRLVNAAAESPTIITNLLSNGYEYQRVINANSRETIAITNNRDTQAAIVAVPAQAFLNASDTANVYLIVSIRSSNAFDSLLTSPTEHPTWDVVEVRLSNGDTQLAGGQSALVTLSFRDDNQDGFVDGTLIRWNSLRVMRHPGTPGGAWEATATTASKDPTATTAGWLQVQTTRFSIFRLTGVAAAANLLNAVVAPNPFRPNDGDPATGLPYTGAAGTGIYFSDLPMQVKIEVYTISGRKVMEFQTTNSTGQIQWDVRNRDGVDVASGVYLYRIQDLATGQVKTGKLTVIR
jgi:hypothetical protein